MNCTCPSAADTDDFDGREDIADACSNCPEHGTAA